MLNNFGYREKKGHFQLSTRLLCQQDLKNPKSNNKNILLKEILTHFLNLPLMMLQR